MCVCVQDPDDLKIETPFQSSGFGCETAEASARPQQSRQGREEEKKQPKTKFLVSSEFS